MIRQASELTILKRYRRSVASSPHEKRLVEVQHEADLRHRFGAGIGDLCQTVVFYLLESASEQLYWGKRWFDERLALQPAFMDTERCLRTRSVGDLCLSVGYQEEYGHLFEFDAFLFESKQIVHYWDRKRHFSARECEEIERVGNVMVGGPGLPRARLSAVTDFQIVRTPTGLKYLDFEPIPTARRSNS